MNTPPLYTRMRMHIFLLRDKEGKRSHPPDTERSVHENLKLT